MGLNRHSIALALCTAALGLLASCQQQQGQAPEYTPTYEYKKGYSARLVSGKAVAPADAPPRIKKAIAAANKIINKPYRRGGGHAKHNDTGYDCSGSVAFVLREAGMLKQNAHPVSGDFLRWGRPGYGKWLTVYAKQGHVFLMIAGLRFDTTGSGRGVGPRWYEASRASKGFKVRHIPGY